jgi:formyltetrahydrofolate hydrolase
LEAFSIEISHLFTNHLKKIIKVCSQNDHCWYEFKLIFFLTLLHINLHSQLTITNYDDKQKPIRKTICIPHGALDETTPKLERWQKSQNT